MAEKVRILNRRMALPAEQVLAKPQVQVFDWPDGTAVAFDTNSLCALKVSPKLAKRLKRGRVANLSGLLGSGIAPAFKCYKASPVRKVVLNVTHGCNLKCEYCFAARYKRAPKMSLQTALGALALFDPKHDINISFFGGEPLLAWELMMQVSERAHVLARERGVRCKLHVTTNGTRIDAVKAAALKRYGFSILMSIDGPEKLHNANRPAKRGNSFQQTMRGLDALNAAGLKPMIRATFREKDARLVEKLNFFADFYDAGKISGASIEPVILSEGCGAAPDEKMNAKKLAGEWHAAAEWFVARVRAGKVFPYFYFQKMLSRLLYCRHMGAECGAGKGYLTLGPDGTMFACHRETGTKIGHVEAGFDTEARAQWLDNRITTHNNCASCWARYLCGGGCRQARIELGGSIHAPTPHLCAVKRALYAEVLWIAANLTGDQAMDAAGMKRKTT